MIGGIIRFLLVVGWFAGLAARGEASPGAAEFHREVQPVLEKYCFDCHADGANKGNVAFDEFASDSVILEDRDLWWRALKNLRAGLMPPHRKPQPSAAEKQVIEHWIKRAVFLADPRNPDPGRITIHRLNRVEYQNTLRDLLGVNFDALATFPPDDSGHGFENISDVLTLPPMLLEKFVSAAEQVIGEGVPSGPGFPREQVIPGRQFRGGSERDEGGNRQRRRSGLSLSYYQPAAVSNTFHAEFDGKYQLALALVVNERHLESAIDHNKCQLIFRADKTELLRREFNAEADKPFYLNREVHWRGGAHELVFELRPLTPGEKQSRSLTLQISSVTVRGPMEKQHLVKPANYDRFFPRPVPPGVKQRRAYARELLSDFASEAFRRPVDAPTLDRLTELAEGVYARRGKSFEAGVSQAMIAVLASPRFLFREERLETPSSATYPLVDEFSLASRLSYFLWSSMPDRELRRLAGAGKLRQNLTAQVDRMLKDARAEAFVRNFTGQWLRARDIETVPIEANYVLQREDDFDPEFARLRKRYRELRGRSENQLTSEERDEMKRLRAELDKRESRPPRAELTGELRNAMRRETERTFEYILREDRRLLELLETDYTFLNERLARHYGITNVSGNELRLVKLPAGSPRGGVLTQGTMLGVTSNPTRTSPVKRGVFILENILGTPPPPPPPNVPPLENSDSGDKNRVLSLRETLAIHRREALCSSCHDRMDSLGLAFENFNAMGMWRDAELGEPVDPTGKLITGEEFHDVRELKQILVKNHSEDFYRTITEKLLTYALGRGLEYYDVETVDQIVARIEQANGRASALIAGVIESAPFQKSRVATAAEPQKAGRKVELRSDNNTK